MGLDGMEVMAVVVVIGLFVVVFKQFGMWEPLSLEESGDSDLELSMARHQPEGLDQLQAQTQFTRKELQSLYRGFKNECPSGLVDEQTFKIIYSQFFPQGDATTYAHFLFNAFDIDRNGSIRFEDFVFGLSVLLRGSVTDKLRWAFNLYDINKDGYVTKEEMLAIMTSIYDMMGRFTFPSVRDDAPVDHVDRFFQKMDQNRDGVVTIDEFIETCQKDESIMASMQLFENECPSGLVDEQTFKIIYSQFFPQGDATTYAHFLFNAFDIDRNGSIRFEDFVFGLSVLLRGSVTDKLRWAFNLYDINKDGYVTKEEMLAIMTSIYDMMGRFTFPSVRDDAPVDHVDRFFQKMDQNRDGVVTIDEFIETCQKDESIMASMQLFENVI
ncbi:hypothetical protein CRUP_004552 [Coryphaenoides rupestris]|nr:hypothetical protein CRUP_004552 [Coryphaenoides rupestris]